MKNNILISSIALFVSLYGASVQAEEAMTPATVAEPQPVATEVAPAKEIAKPAGNNQAAHDNHTDYRYCLELKTNKEIIECRYKKN